MSPSKSPTGIEDLLARVSDLMAAEGAMPVNVLRLDQFDAGDSLRKATGDVASGEGPRELAILHFSKSDAENMAKDAKVDPGLVFPLTLKVVEEGGKVRVEADRFFLKAGDLETNDPEQVQRLIREVDEMVDRVVKSI
jgi:hypothetical protein